MNTLVAPLTVAAVRDLVRPVEPTVSVYLGSPDLDLRWRAMAARLAAQHADEDTLAAVAERLAGCGPGEVALFASGGYVRLVQPLPGSPPLDRARFGVPASVIPLLDWYQRHPAYVAVLTDRTGADLTVVPRGAWEGGTYPVPGPDDEIERNAPGGWSQPRYQRRAEDSWRHNAAAVAGATVRAVRDSGAGLVLVGGDVRAEQLLCEYLAPLVRHGVTVHHVTGGRSPDGSASGRALATAAAVRGYADRQTAAMLTALDRHGGRRGTAVHGARATLAALAAGRVRTLFVADRESDERIGALAAPRHHGVGPVVRGRLVDVAVRAALLTDADIRVVEPGTVHDDIAALCRFRTPT
jgi:hypothetical protein